MASAKEVENRSPMDADWESFVDALKIIIEVVSFIEKTYPSRETCLSRTLTPNPGELIIASWARLILVSLLTKFSLACRVNGITLLLSWFFPFLDFLLGFSNFLVFWIF